MRIDVVTLFPGMVEPVLDASMLGRARARGLVDIRVVNLRDYAGGKHRITDDYQFGRGGDRARVVGERLARAGAVHTARGVPWRARPGGAPLRGSHAGRAVAAGAGALGHVAGPAGPLEGRGFDIRRAAARRTIRAWG